MPKWTSHNLTKHYQLRINEDQGCFEDLLNINDRKMTESEYELRADEAVDKAWAEYECESFDNKSYEFRDSRCHFVDDDLVEAITDNFKHNFITCFHKHFGLPRGIDPRSDATVGQKRLRYLRILTEKEKGKKIRKLRRIKGV